MLPVQMARFDKNVHPNIERLRVRLVAVDKITHPTGATLCPSQIRAMVPHTLREALVRIGDRPTRIFDGGHHDRAANMREDHTTGIYLL